MCRGMHTGAVFGLDAEQFAERGGGGTVAELEDSREAAVHNLGRHGRVG